MPMTIDAVLRNYDPTARQSREVILALVHEAAVQLARQMATDEHKEAYQNLVLAEVQLGRAEEFSE